MAPPLTGDMGPLSVCASFSLTSLPLANASLSHSAHLIFLKETGLYFLAPGWLRGAVILEPVALGFRDGSRCVQGWLPPSLKPLYQEFIDSCSFP